jgi:GT2 family glycosyltransferase
MDRPTRRPRCSAHATQNISLPVQTGFCAAVNAGLRRSDSAYVALLNNDAVAASEWLSASLGALAHRPEFSACVPRILFKDRPNVINSLGISLRVSGACRDIAYNQPDSTRYDTPAEVFGFSGCAVVLRREAIDQVGLFDEQLGSYSEDLDWVLRARRRGLRFLYEPDARVYHQQGGSFSRLPADMTYLQNRNSLYVLLKNLRASFLVKHLHQLVVFHSYQVLRSAARGQFRAALKGKRDALVLWRRHLAQRGNDETAGVRAGDVERSLRQSPFQVLAESLESSREVS